MRRVALLLALVLLLTTCSPRPMQVQSGTLTVTFDGGDRVFNVNGQPYGHVNTPATINAGTYTIDLGEPRNYEPPHVTVAIDELQSATIAFRRVSP